MIGLLTTRGKIVVKQDYLFDPNELRCQPHTFRTQTWSSPHMQITWHHEALWWQHFPGVFFKKLTHCGLVMPYGELDLGQQGSGNGLVPDGTKPLPEPMLTYHQTCSVAFIREKFHKKCSAHELNCPACRTTLVATRFRVAVICPIIQVPHCIRVFFYFVWFVFVNHIFQFYYELCTYCNILDIYLS